MSQAPALLLDALLSHCVSRDASDLHLSSGERPFFRVRGELERSMEFPVLSKEMVHECAQRLANIAGKERCLESSSVDGAIPSTEGRRFRFNIYRQQQSYAIAIRKLEDQIRNLQQLGLPESLYELTEEKDGLVIVAGPTGSGKSTTLAALIDRINSQFSSHIITIEDPIEYLHTSKNSMVHQRQVGHDTDGFHSALVDSLRQDPDVILVGEVRELNTVRTAITAAETGHLVFTTVHASDCVGVIERLISVFPAEEQHGVRKQLSLVLKAVIVQHLIVCDGPGIALSERRGRSIPQRVIASEILRVTPGIANLISNSKSAQIYSSIESGTAAGMQTMDQDLARLLHGGFLSERAAMAYAHNPQIVQDRFLRMRSKRPLPTKLHGGHSE